MPAQPTPDAAPTSPIAALCTGLDLAGLSPAEKERFSLHWESLEQQGFQTALRRDFVEIRHPQRGFEAVVQLSDADDLGERREVFRALRTAFGTLTERWLPWLVQSSPTVTRAYQDIREIVEICQALRRPGAPRAS
jgi:hypothetical protein